MEVLCAGSVPARAEGRTAAICVNGAGESRLAIAARGWVLIVDPLTGGSTQLHFPGRPEFPYASLATRDGTFWTGAGTMLHRVDPFASTLTSYKVAAECEPDEIIGMGFAEGPDGTIWFTGFPRCRLYRIDPVSGEITVRARLSPTEQYAQHLAVDDDGRVYVGIGTEHRDLLMLTDEQSEPRSIVPGGAQGKGSGYVHRGIDGRIYGHWDSAQTKPANGSTHDWHLLTAGRAVAVASSQVAASQIRGYGFERIHVPTDPGWSVQRLALADRQLVVAMATSAEVLAIELEYESAGAKLSAFVGTSEGPIVGTTTHPMRFYRLDPDSCEIVEIDRGSLASAGGNVCAWAELGGQLYGAAYAGGYLYRYDPSEPATAQNPLHLVDFEQIHRPRCVLAHPDGRHILWGGYGGYGDTGGGLGIHRVDGTAQGENTLIKHTDLVPHHATVALGSLAGGDVIGATSVETPGGAQARESAAVVYRLAWPSLDQTARWTPDPEVRTWAGLAVAADDTLHLFSDGGVHLHFDPVAGAVLARDDWSADGALAKSPIIVDRETGANSAHRVAVLQAQAISILDVNDHTVRRYPWPHAPITAGGALCGSYAHFASGELMLRVRLPENHRRNS